MGKINILDSSVFNRIAAGEVVERPASVLKELLDNSIDAGASSIIINCYEGGIKQIEVIDNGQGIMFDDLQKAFLPHATSKIKTADDLEKIGTLGFRGEALASIAAVSEVSIISKTQDEEIGGKIIARGGNIENITEYGAPNGTTVKMENLFYNVPARAKFLKKPKQEASELTNLVLRYILANPNIKIKYNLDGTEIYSSTGNGLFEAIYTVYGKQTTENILKVNFKGSNGITVSGYIGNQTFTKPNRTYQTLIVNNRYVMSQMVSLCVYNAFEHSLMKGQFPFFVLKIDMPLNSLDVNVHPNKMEVRFENSNNLYGIIYTAIMDTLNTNDSNIVEVKKVFDFKETNIQGVSFNSEETKAEEKPKTVEIKTENNSTLNFYESLNKTKSMQSPNVILSNVLNKIENSNQTETKNNEIKEKPTLFNKEQILSTNNNIQTKMFENDYKIIGVLFDTYILVQADEKVYMIDQHASHERLNYDKLVKQVNSKSVNVQYLLVPYTFTVNSQENEFLENNLENLTKLGFDISVFGNNSFKVSAVPQLLQGINLKSFFDGILSEISVFKNLKQADLVLEKLMQHSCKTAVKAGDTLSNDEIKALIDQIEDTNMKLQCPHGRPVIIKLDKKEIEKWFKRIV